MASSSTDPDAGDGSDDDPAWTRGSDPLGGRPDDRPRCAGDRPRLHSDGFDRTVARTPTDHDPEVQAVIDQYERLLSARRAAYERRLAAARRRGPLGRLRRWLGGLF